MAVSNVAVKMETPEEMLKRVLAENAALKAQITVAAGEFSLGVTKKRAPGTNGEKDKGSDGGSLHIKLGKQNLFPSVAMLSAIFDHEADCRKFVADHATELTR